MLFTWARKILNLCRNFFKLKLLHPWVIYGKNVHIQFSVKIWSPNRILHIGDHVGIGYRCEINTDVLIGNHVLIGSSVGLLARDAHTYDKVGCTMFDSPRGDRYRIVIEDDVWIGFGAIILSGVTIGRGSIIAAGSVVTKDIPRYSIYASKKGEVLRLRFTSEQIIEHEKALGQLGILKG